MQCAATAATAVGTASGLRVWLATHSPVWLTPRRLRTVTIALFSLALLASGLFVSGTG